MWISAHLATSVDVWKITVRMLPLMILQKKLKASAKFYCNILLIMESRYCPVGNTCQWGHCTFPGCFSQIWCFCVLAFLFACLFFKDYIPLIFYNGKQMQWTGNSKIGRTQREDWKDLWFLIFEDRKAKARLLNTKIKYICFFKKYWVLSPVPQKKKKIALPISKLGTYLVTTFKPVSS